jgi:hypothetical protein
MVTAGWCSSSRNAPAACERRCGDGWCGGLLAQEGLGRLLHRGGTTAVGVLMGGSGKGRTGGRAMTAVLGGENSQFTAQRYVVGGRRCAACRSSNSMFACRRDGTRRLLVVDG